jgi:hypothetical protein
MTYRRVALANPFVSFLHSDSWVTQFEGSLAILPSVLRYSDGLTLGLFTESKSEISMMAQHILCIVVYIEREFVIRGRDWMDLQDDSFL